MTDSISNGVRELQEDAESGEERLEENPDRLSSGHMPLWAEVLLTATVTILASGVSLVTGGVLLEAVDDLINATPAVTMSLFAGCWLGICGGALYAIHRMGVRPRSLVITFMIVGGGRALGLPSPPRDHGCDPRRVYGCGLRGFLTAKSVTRG